jgi:hypothetical protein
VSKQPILVCHDYGTGGVWAVVLANSAAEVKRKYPWLATFEERPQWLSQEEYEAIASTQVFDIDDAPSGWLLTAVQEHGARGP